MKKEKNEKHKALAKELNTFLAKALPIVNQDTHMLYHMINILVAALVTEKILDPQNTIGNLIHYLADQNLMEVSEMSEEEVEGLKNMDIPPKHELN